MQHTLHNHILLPAHFHHISSTVTHLVHIHNCDTIMHTRTKQLYTCYIYIYNCAPPPPHLLPPNICQVHRDSYIIIRFFPQHSRRAAYIRWCIKICGRVMEAQEWCYEVGLDRDAQTLIKVLSSRPAVFGGIYRRGIFVKENYLSSYNLINHKHS